MTTRRGHGPVDLDEDSCFNEESTTISLNSTTSTGGPIDMDLIYDQEEEFNVIWNAMEGHENQLSVWKVGDTCRAANADEDEGEDECEVNDDTVDNTIFLATNPFIETTSTTTALAAVVAVTSRTEQGICLKQKILPQQSQQEYYQENNLKKNRFLIHSVIRKIRHFKRHTSRRH